MKYFLNHNDEIVNEALEGLMALTPNQHLSRIDGALSVSCKNEGRKVKIIIGGGSGHEPLFAGMVGPGMADAAVMGYVFAAPSPMAIVKTAKAVAKNGEDVIVLYGNYSGDVLNFDMAQEDLEDEGIKSAAVRVHDEIASAAVEDRQQRRGTAGATFVLKCVSAAADRGLELDEIIRIAEKANEYTRTIGVAAGAADSPSDGRPMFEIPEGKVEIGMGVHGEKGVFVGDFTTADEIVDQMLQRLWADFEATETQLEDVAVLINGLGRTTLLELLVITRKVKNSLAEKQIKVSYCNAGEFETSLNMHGFSITLMALDEELKSLLFEPAQSFGFSL
ncbi:dihydroxyacetone kinase subunit DhaK [Pullulanibacillus sp. KACC 23026]|uniref:dihydroxyacetone kinase subunit DhaK n=1 Tax=Pullulanibacillus sp. KACC 23026 TaxID=3028315 RepID=UPI0023B154F2|nr:dihydroxyacetone kinase subunit DhaK [Pullulanibacillus sp. KACC 23026]WEG13319.1 dihydroxyacetone kinase subunit DhaK [Pullulanibacillus sp. KACC 23026]